MLDAASVLTVLALAFLITAALNAFLYYRFDNEAAAVMGLWCAGATAFFGLSGAALALIAVFHAA